MERSPLIEYFDTWLGNTIENFRLAADHHDPEGVHDYRVALKRLKALFRLAGTIEPDFSARNRFREFRVLFKAGEDLRDIHIQTGVADDFADASGFPVKEYRDYLAGLERDAAGRFDRFAAGFDIGVLGKRRKVLVRAVGTLEPAVLPRRVRERFGRLFGDLVEKVERSRAADEEMHGIRILAKEVHYVREMLDACAPGGEDSGVFFAKLKKAHQALGHWHDCEVARSYLAGFWEASGAGIGTALAIAEAGKERHREAFLRAWGEFIMENKKAN